MQGLWPCRDAESLVALEAIKALFGALPGEAGTLGGPPPPEDLARAARTRQRAWAFVANQVSTHDVTTTTDARPGLCPC